MSVPKREVAIPTGMIRVMLADDHPVVRGGLKQLIDSQSDMCVVGEAADGEDAWQLATSLGPDVLVVDLSMPVVDGVEATRRVKRDRPSVQVLALSVHEERVYLTQLLRAGASGYVLKRTAAEELLRAIRTVAKGETYIDPALAGTVVEGYLDSQLSHQPHSASLSEREREVLIRIATGFSNKEIAAELALSVKTVETYKGRVAEKLGLRTRVQIVKFAAEQGWLAE
jgi:DNA-binding NarL/FixJ family response regulator